jgi:hypothetical protein
VDAYRTMFMYCTGMMAIALTVAAVWLRFPAPAPAMAPATTTEVSPAQR